jgi:cupin 2 domain-containing protein
VNLFADLPKQLPEEMVTTLLAAAKLRIERIVSQGHASAPDFWYNQDQHEWVIVLQGSASSMKSWR